MPATPPVLIRYNALRLARALQFIGYSTFAFVQWAARDAKGKSLPLLQGALLVPVAPAVRGAPTHWSRMDADAAAAPSTARAQAETGSTKLTVSFPQTPPTSPAVSPPRSRSVSPPDAVTYTQRGPPAPAAARGREKAEDFSVLAGVADDGSPRVLAESEYHRAVLISHNRRDPAALNATYALISALRGECDESGRVREPIDPRDPGVPSREGCRVGDRGR